MAKSKDDDDKFYSNVFKSNDKKQDDNTGPAPKVGDFVYYQSEEPGDVQWSLAIVTSVNPESKKASLRLIGDTTLHTILQKDVPQFSRDALKVENPEGRGYKLKDAAA